MKKAVITAGSKQYLVAEGEKIEVELLKTDKKKIEFEALLLIDGNKIEVGAPTLKSVSVSCDVLEEDIKTDKVSGVRFKAKKRVHKVHGHRQRKTVLRVASIA